MANAYASALSTNGDSTSAIEEVCAAVREQLGASPTLAVLFMSAHHVEAADAVASLLRERLDADCMIGCSGESIVGVSTEVEMEPAISLWGAKLPGARPISMHLEFVRTSEGGSIVGWPRELPHEWPDGSALLVLGDPFSFPPELLLQRINEDQPQTVVVGGMASAASQPGDNRLLIGDRTVREGAVAVFLPANVSPKTVVSQGCRPIGTHFVITKAERNTIQQLGGMPAYQRLIEVYQALPTREQRMLQRGLHVGRVVSEYQDSFEQGDFLIRNVIGVDQEGGAIAIGDYVRPGQTVQFHLRDAETADMELRQLLTTAAVDFQARAALLFTCNGRGTRLFPEPHHDAAAIERECGSIPLAGFFAAGEIGPIGGKNFLHGFTASIALFA